MKLTNMTIRNVKSFRDETPISFDPEFNIFLGPNAGGKSNLLDIITIVIRQLFLWGYTIVEDGGDSVLRQRLERTTAFKNIKSVLKKFAGENGDSIIEL